MRNNIKYEILVIEDEKNWQDKLSNTLKEHCACNIKLIDTFREADIFVQSNDLSDFKAVLIDVRLRKQIYDQSGLTILDLIKEKNATIPILVLTAYSYDYPSIRKITERYSSILTYDKNIFISQPQAILDSLFADLPPQIGDITKSSHFKRTLEGIVSRGHVPEDQINPIRVTILGFVMVAFILLTTISFLLIFKSFPNNSWQLNIVFSVLIIVLLSVLIKIFNFKVVNQAFGILKELKKNNSKD